MPISMEPSGADMQQGYDMPRIILFPPGKILLLVLLVGGLVALFRRRLQSEPAIAFQDVA